MTTTQFETIFKNQLKSIHDDREANNITDWVFENITGLKKWQDAEKIRIYYQVLKKIN